MNYPKIGQKSRVAWPINRTRPHNDARNPGFVVQNDLLRQQFAFAIRRDWRGRIRLGSGSTPGSGPRRCLTGYQHKPRQARTGPVTCLDQIACPLNITAKISLFICAPKHASGVINMVHAPDGLVETLRVQTISRNDFNIPAAQPAQFVGRPDEASHFLTPCQQGFREMASDEPGPAGNQSDGHCVSPAIYSTHSQAVALANR